MSHNVPIKRSSLNQKQGLALQALIDGHSQKDAAAMAGVSARTLRRWIRENEKFKQELDSRMSELLGNATLRLVGSMDLAADVLKK